jgi:hypothetical protein
MVDHTQACITESNIGMQRLVLMTMLAIGLALAAASRHFDASGLTPSLSAFALGVLMLVIGASGCSKQLQQAIETRRTAACTPPSSAG